MTLSNLAKFDGIPNEKEDEGTDVITVYVGNLAFTQNPYVCLGHGVQLSYDSARHVYGYGGSSIYRVQLPLGSKLGTGPDKEIIIVSLGTFGDRLGHWYLQPSEAVPITREY